MVVGGVGGVGLRKITCFLTLHNLFLDCVSHFYEKPALLNHLSQSKHQNKKVIVRNHTYRETHMILPVWRTMTLTTRDEKGKNNLCSNSHPF